MGGGEKSLTSQAELVNLSNSLSSSHSYAEIVPQSHCIVSQTNAFEQAVPYSLMKYGTIFKDPAEVLPLL